MSARLPAARVAIARRPLWRLRLARESGRYAVLAASCFGLLASARFAIAPPAPRIAAEPGYVRSLPDLAAQGFAVRFVRAYLTWSGEEPAPAAEALEGFGGPQLEPDLGIETPASGSERVLWAEVVQSREPDPGVHVYTVAAATAPGGLRYVTVPVKRTAAGPLALAGYPAFVGAPASGPASLAASLPAVTEPALELVVRRALGNYLSDSPDELAADLSANASVAPPASPLRLLSSGHMEWASAGTVAVTVQARDAIGVRYTLGYELDVTRVRERWEISAIEADPDV